MRRTSKTTLQELIKAQGYTQREVARKIGMKPYQFCRMVKDEDNIRLSQLREVVQAIGLRVSVSIDYEL